MFAFQLRALDVHVGQDAVEPARQPPRRLADALDALVAEAGAQLETIHSWTPTPPAPLATFLEHIETNAEVYRRAFAEPGSAVVLARLRTHVNVAVHDLAGRHRDVAVPLDVVAAGVAGTGIGVMGAWLA